MDYEKNEVKMCIVNHYNSNIETECIYSNLPNNKFSPYFNMGSTSKGCTIRVAQVPQSWYGQHRDNIFN